MKKTFLLPALAGLMVVVSACSQPAEGSVLQSDKPRDETPSVSAGDAQTLVDGNTTFALKLYHQIKEEGENLFYSPYSISMALAMTYAGANGETEQQMAEAMNFYLSQEDLHPAFNSLDQELASRGEGAQGKDGEGFRLNVVNALWGQKDYDFLDSFLDTLAVNYGAGLRILDFVKAPEESRVTINDWVSDETEGRIEELIPEGIIDAMTRLVLTNAIYFNAAWADPFNENATQDGPFYLLDGSTVTVPLMRQTEGYGYTEGAKYQAVEMPYDGHELSMVIILPGENEYNNFEDGLDTNQLNAILGEINHQEVNLTLPKFEFTADFELTQALSNMGMPIAFDAGADFSGMTGKRDLFIGSVIHQAYVGVDEAGTEAAAATAVEMELTAAPAMPVTMTIDRPFIFLIRDIETGSILFMGRILNPAG
jgi:serpin B